jgi:gas vesicle protein GvpA/GvpJ/GvpM family
VTNGLMASDQMSKDRFVAWHGEEGPSGPIGVPLVDLLDRVLATGVVVSGDIVIAIAEVPLIRLSLHALLSSVSDRVRAPFADGGPL